MPALSLSTDHGPSNHDEGVKQTAGKRKKETVCRVCTTHDSSSVSHHIVGHQSRSSMPLQV